MSRADQDKWDARYAGGAYQTRRHPSAVLEQNAALLPNGGRALDIACGTGRNAIYLATRGLAVDAVDISRVALDRGRAEAGELPIRWIERDLDDGFHPPASYDLILNIRYVNPVLVRSLIGSLRPGGVLIIEQHLRTDEDVVGPSNAEFRVAEGALAELACGLVVEHLAEGLFRDPDGQAAALARLVAQKPAQGS